MIRGVDESLSGYLQAAIDLLRSWRVGGRVRERSTF